MEELNSVLEAEHLSFAYREGELALDDVSLSLKQGEYLAVLGHNGSGKSTLARLLIGLLSPKSGTVRILGEEMTEKNAAKLTKKMGIVFQNPDNQFVASSVEEDIAFGLENLQMPRDEMIKAVKEAAEAVGMEGYLQKSPENLSGGQKQRVALAGVMAMKPEILLLDEATSMLDPRGKREVYEALRKMRAGNASLSVISITHDVEEALLSDRIIVLNGGKIVMEGTPKEVFSDSKALKELKLYPPFAYRLAEALKEEGIDIDPQYDLEKSLEALWK